MIGIFIYRTIIDGVNMQSLCQGSFELKDIKGKNDLPDEVDAIMNAYLDNTLMGILIDFFTGDVMINNCSNGMNTTIFIIKKTNKCIYSLIFKAA